MAKEEATSNMTIAVTMAYLVCHKVKYSWKKSKRVQVVWGLVIALIITGLRVHSGRSQHAITNSKYSKY